MNSTNLEIIQEIEKELKMIKTSKDYFSRPADFTRTRVFTFETLFYLICDLPRQSLSLELHRGLKAINGDLGLKTVGTKSGFSRARQKINWELFEWINKKLVSLYYEKQKSLKKWKGFFLKAVDGSIMDIINTPENAVEFGVHKNQYSEVVQGRIMLQYDVLNKIITRSSLNNISIGEGSILKDWLGEMQADDLGIYDRLYPGSALQYLHEQQGAKYVMRCKLSHNAQVKAFVASKKKEQTVFCHLSDRGIRDLRARGIEVNKQDGFLVRMLRIELANGQVEVLLTNLLDNKKSVSYTHLTLPTKRIV